MSSLNPGDIVAGDSLDVVVVFVEVAGLRRVDLPRQNIPGVSGQSGILTGYIP